ncbi:MAG: hypothetical protein AB8G95_01595 [Anaerolineae bacterium]
MGTQFEFKCQQCQYCANVSGGADFGFVIKTQTAFCFTCDELRDIVVGFRGVEQMSPHDQAELDFGRVDHCPKCLGQELAAWDEGDPCPKCNGKVVRTRVIMDWD